MSSVKFVPASGKCAAGLMVIGEAPGEEEEKQGKPFVGRAGKLLDKMLDYIGLNRENVYITNVVKVRPTTPNHEDYEIFYKNRTPTDEELESWRPLLIKEIKEINPKIIFALGACAAKTLLGWNKFTNMTTVRGRIFTHNDMQIICSWHPAYLLRKQGDKKTNDQVKTDLQLVQEQLNK